MISNDQEQSNTEADNKKNDNLVRSSEMSNTLISPSPSSVTNAGIDFPDIHLPSPPSRSSLSNRSTSKDEFPDLILPTKKEEDQNASSSPKYSTNGIISTNASDPNKTSSKVIISNNNSDSNIASTACKNNINNTQVSSLSKKEPCGKIERSTESIVSSQSTVLVSSLSNLEEDIGTDLAAGKQTRKDCKTATPSTCSRLNNPDIPTADTTPIDPPVDEATTTTTTKIRRTQESTTSTTTSTSTDNPQQQPQDCDDDGDDEGNTEGANKQDSKAEKESTSMDTPSQMKSFKPIFGSTISANSSSLLAKQVKSGISKRSDFPLIPSKVALLIIDIQEYLSQPSPLEEEPNLYFTKESLPLAISNIEKLLGTVRHYRDHYYYHHQEQQQHHIYANNNSDDGSGCEVIFTYLESLTTDCRDVSLDYKLSGPKLSTLPGPQNPATFLQTIHPSREGKGDISIPKTSCSVFCSTNLQYVLNNLHVEQLIICGQLTDQCVESAVRDAADLGFFVTVAEDACAAQSQSSHVKGIEGMTGFARIVSTQQILEELQTAASSTTTTTTSTIDTNITQPSATLAQEESATDLWTLVPPTAESNTTNATIQVANTSSNMQQCAAENEIDGNTSSSTTTTTTITNTNTNESSMTKDSPSTTTLAAVASTPSSQATAMMIQPSIRITSTRDWNSVPSKSESHNRNKVIVPLLRTLQYAGVKFVRYLSLDICNSIRCKAVPLDHFTRVRRQQDGGGVTLDHAVSLATVVVAGLSTLGDFMIEDTNLDARGVLDIQPDLSTLRVLPYAKKTALLIGTAHDQRTGKLSEFCSRGLLSRVLQTAEKYHGIQFSVGAEIEFCLYSQTSNLPIDDSVFANTTTLNEQEEFISELYDQLQQQDIEIELLHAESAPGQFELVLRYQHDAIQLADNVVLARETISAVARSHQMKALYLPKIHASKAGSGMHVHLSIRDTTENHGIDNAFPHPTCRGDISVKGQHFMEGILSHLPGLTALTIPSHNSFRRIGVGCWTGSSVVWGVEDKEVPLRVCTDLGSRTKSNVELKLLDSTANIYLALAGILSSGLDGIVQQLPLRPMYAPSVDKHQEALPMTFQDSLNCLEQDSFLINDVMGPSLSRAYLALRRAEAEVSLNMTLEDEVQNALQKA